MKNIAIIPARSGSKGVKDKNIRPLNGKPLMAYSIDAALESKMFDDVMVSTDSQKYADIARSYGANIPFLRSASLSTDTSTTKDVILDILKQYESSGKIFETFTILQPTSPLRTAEDIIEAYKLFTDKKANAVIGITETDHSPLICNTLPSDGLMTNFIRKNMRDKPRQMMDTYYRINGAIYIANVNYYQKYGNLYREKCYAYIMEREKSIDIDSEFDFLLAEFLLKENIKKSNYS